VDAVVATDRIDVECVDFKLCQYAISRSAAAARMVPERLFEIRQSGEWQAEGRLLS
jgi:hypothetical protein